MPFEVGKLKANDPVLVTWAGTPPGSAPPDENPVVARYDGEWIELTGTSWMSSRGNPAALIYAMRSVEELPFDDNVHYVHVGAFGHLVHETELSAVPDGR